MSGSNLRGNRSLHNNNRHRNQDGTGEGAQQRIRECEDDEDCEGQKRQGGDGDGPFFGGNGDGLGPQNGTGDGPQDGTGAGKGNCEDCPCNEESDTEEDGDRMLRAQGMAGSQSAFVAAQLNEDADAEDGCEPCPCYGTGHGYGQNFEENSDEDD